MNTDRIDDATEERIRAACAPLPLHAANAAEGHCRCANIRAAIRADREARTSDEEWVESINSEIAHADRLAEVLKHAEEWMSEVGCECDEDHPGTCTVCEARTVLREHEERRK